MVIDTEWDNKVWEESWEPRLEPEMHKESHKARRGSRKGAAKKRTRRESQGVAWGEEVLSEDSSRNEFLRASGGDHSRGSHSTGQSQGLHWGGVDGEGGAQGVCP